MKRASLLVVLALLMASPAMAGFMAQLSDLPPAWGGGPFQVTLTDAASGSLIKVFNTFCVEMGVDLNANGKYYATIDEKVMSGAWNDGNHYTKLQDTTKQLYAAYLNAGSPIGGTAAQDALVMGYQYAIWYSQSHDGSIGSFGYLLDNADVTGWKSVKALNLWSDGDYRGDRQSQLILVPAPGAILLGSLGMGLVGWLRQRRSL